MKEKRIDSDIFTGGILVLACLFFYYKSAGLPSDAAVWPKLILIVTLILSVLLVLSGVKKTLRQTDGTDVLSLKIRELGAPVVVLIVMSAYAVMMDWTGFFVSTAIFLPLGMFLFKQRSLPVLLGVTVGIEVFVYWLFIVQLNLRMP